MSSEIIKITGVIEEKTVKESPTDAEKEWKRFAFKVKGKTYSSFDTANDSFKEGEVVEIEYTVNGAFNNIQKMTKVDVSTLPPEEPKSDEVPSAAPAKTKYVDRDKDTGASIVAQVIIKAVARMVSAGQITPGSFKSNAKVLVDTYKETKKQLLE